MSGDLINSTENYSETSDSVQGDGCDHTTKQGIHVILKEPKNGGLPTIPVSFETDPSPPFTKYELHMLAYQSQILEELKKINFNLQIINDEDEI